jgi:hypothetical protein
MPLHLREDGSYKTSFSELDAYRQCPLKWHIRYDLRLDTDKVKINLERGSAWHAILEDHYNAIRAGKTSVDELVLAVSRSFEIAADTLGGEEADTLLWMYKGYLERWGNDDEWEILEVEARFDVPLTTYTTTEGVVVPVTMGGKADLIARDRMKRIWIWDHKTTKGKDLSAVAWTRTLDLDDQFGIYEAALGKKLGLGLYDVFGTVYAGSRTDRLKRDMTLDERFARHKQFRGENTLAVLWEDAATTARAMLRMSETGEGLYSAPTGDTCAWKCDALEPHLMSRAAAIPIKSALESFNWGPKKYRNPKPGPEEVDGVAKITERLEAVKEAS